METKVPMVPLYVEHGKCAALARGPVSICRFAQRKNGAVLSLAAKDSKEDSGQEPIKTDTHAHQLEVRVVSAAFPLPGNKTGCYACSNLGFTLLEWKEGSCPIANSQQNKHISQTPRQEDRLEPSSGDLLALTLSSAPNRRDEKTGAVVIPI